MTTDRPLLGIALMLGFCLLAPVADALAKLLGPHLAVGQLVALRFAIQALVLVPVTLVGGRAWRLAPSLLAWVALRTLLHIAGIATMFTAFLYLPLADAIAIAYVMPFILLLFGHLMLGEEVGLRRLGACAVGFVGTLLVIQPAFREVGAAALLPLAVAVIFALFMLVTRRIAAQTDPLGMQAVSAVMAVILLAPVLALAPPGIAMLAWQQPPAALWGLILAMGLAGTLAHLLLTWSLRYAPASTLAPMQYLEIPIAAAVGLVVFGDLPGPLAALGIVITVGAGLYIVLRERAIAQRPRAAPPAAALAPSAAGSAASPASRTPDAPAP
jgi:drug/metabolite transporter (DMT)-like permease